MAVHVVRLGTARKRGEGLRLGTVRRPPRGVPKTRFASEDWYDIWFPNLAPSAETVKLGLGAQTEAEWRSYKKKYLAEMSTAENTRVIALLAALSHQTDFSIGCYCEDEQRCHRSILRDLLQRAGASIAER